MIVRILIAMRLEWKMKTDNLLKKRKIKFRIIKFDLVDIPNNERDINNLKKYLINNTKLHSWDETLHIFQRHHKTLYTLSLLPVIISRFIVTLVNSKCMYVCMCMRARVSAYVCVCCQL